MPPPTRIRHALLFCCLLRNRCPPDSQIRQHVFENIPDHRRRYGSAVVDPLGVVDDAQPQHRGLIRRRKAQKGGNIPVGAPGQRLGGRRLTADRCSLRCKRCSPSPPTPPIPESSARSPRSLPRRCRSCVSYSRVSTTLPSPSSTRTPKCGVTRVPPLISELTVAAS